MNKIEKKNYHRMRRQNRIRAKISGTKDAPRLAVFRSARHLNAQLIDDGSGMKVRPDLQTKAVESSGGTLVTPDATVNGSWELLLPQPGRYKVRARYQLGDRMVESNKVSIEVLGTP